MIAWSSLTNDADFPPLPLPPPEYCPFGKQNAPRSPSPPATTSPPPQPSTSSEPSVTSTPSMPCAKEEGDNTISPPSQPSTSTEPPATGPVASTPPKPLDKDEEVDYSMASEMFCSWSVISDTRNRKNRRGSARTRCSSPQVPERRRTGWVKEGQPFGFLRGGAPQDKQETLVEHFTNLKLTKSDKLEDAPQDKQETLVEHFTNLKLTKSDKLEDVELLSVQQNIPPVVLQTDLTKCPVCCVGDMVERTASTSDMVIYGRNGLKMAKHKKFRCSNRNKEQGI